jgi:hypothetical protein
VSEELSFASRIRKFFDDLFYSSLVEQLRADLMFARSDVERVRLDKDQVIAELRAEKATLFARIAMYDAKAGLRPPNETPKKPSFGVDFSIPPMETSWQKLSREHDEKIARELAEEQAKANEKPVAQTT